MYPLHRYVRAVRQGVFAYVGSHERLGRSYYHCNLIVNVSTQLINLRSLPTYKVKIC